MVDARKSLETLHEEWSDCQKCTLGQRRMALQRPLLTGGGAVGRILIVGEAPSEAEEQNGRLLDDMNWQNKPGPLYLLSSMLEKAGLTEHCYYTTVVACRACQPAIDNESGQPIIRRGMPVFRDGSPTSDQGKACRPRLHEQVYLIDPIVILALGATAASALIGRDTAIGNILGEPQHIEIPGASNLPRITEKAKVWGRKLKGEMLWPTDQNMVRYLMIPTVTPKQVADTMADTAKGSYLHQLAEDLKKTSAIFFKYAVDNALITKQEALEAEDEDDDDDE